MPPITGRWSAASSIRRRSADGEGAFELQPAVLGKAFHLQERVLVLRERTAAVDPLREGLQVRDHPVDGAVGEAALPVLMDLAPEIVDELAGHPRRPVEALLGADHALQEGDEQPEVPRLLLPGALPVVTSVAK